MDQHMPRAQRITVNQALDDCVGLLDHYLMNLSRTGAFIYAVDPRPVGTTLNLSLVIVEPRRIHTIEGDARVVRTSHNPPGMGVSFDDLSFHSREVIDRLLTRPQRAA